MKIISHSIMEMTLLLQSGVVFGRGLFCLAGGFSCFVLFVCFVGVVFFFF